jgi:predicted regulator of Ras-like GTPase activity (Roadblock/LC7/MglB family)
MAKLTQLEELIQALIGQDHSVRGCAVVSRHGQGDMLYQVNMESIDRTLLSTLINSILLLVERLGSELEGVSVDYNLVGYGHSVVLIMPCSEAVALLVRFELSESQSAVINAVRDTARKIGELLRNKALED